MDVGNDCNCPTDYADGALSECCICWDPNTHEGACGTYFGIAVCRTEAKDVIDTNPSWRQAVVADSNMKAKQFDFLLKKLEKEGFDVAKIKSSFYHLVKKSL